MPNKIDLSKLFSELEREGVCELDRLLDKKELLVPGPEAETVSRALRPLSQKSRLKILLLLYYNGPLPVCIISRALELDQTLVSHHLKSLKASGLVEYEKVAKYRLYKLTNYTTKILRLILETILEPPPHATIKPSNSEGRQSGDFDRL